ncbi:glycosyltransferase family 2 protein [Paenibacillus abyssi]|uniref:Glycosyl transferase family A n=1 Tax=Paenibacillus abyssi TaxID=1340531 RepID=A0A917CZV4_9BACL|nr:glycosyltransferase family A protein [Paenibacillus abyssi]GGG04134.1 glycosyl transferase family A [Paenibacillus abyssi]
MVKEKVTVILPVYNREHYIENAIVSIVNQTLQDWKMLIINDGSTDGTADVIDNYVSEKISHVKLSKNQGTGKALQIALDLIGTPYFMIVDSDDWIEPQTLEVLLHEMEKQPKNTSLVYANTVIWRKNKGIPEYSIEKHRSFQDKYDFIMYRPMVYPRFFRTETVRRVNGFETDDPYRGRYAEDRYLLLKLIAISDFHWVNANLYNLRRSHTDYITNGKHQKCFTAVLRYVYLKMLKQWGDKYEPEFGMDRYGWLYLKKLKKKKK